MILFFGPPGSGKSVQGQLLVERNGWAWLSTGELFRKTTDPEILECMAKGELISDDMTNRLVDDALKDLEGAKHIVLDGYPRNVLQAQWLLNNAPAHKREVRALIVFETPEEELVKRLMGRGRSEDTEEVIKRRLEIYSEQTQPVLDFYKTKNLPIITVDGLGEVNDIHERIQAAVVQQDLV